MFVKNISKLDPVVCSCAVCCYIKSGMFASRICVKLGAFAVTGLVEVLSNF